MQNIRKHSLIDRYGISNIAIVIICITILIINSIFVSDTALSQLAANKSVAYILNFFAGCEGKIGTIGSMSKVKVFSNGEWWRLFLHMYLHVGVIHMAFNVFVLLFVGKAVEKNIGSTQYFVLYHLIAVINAIIMSLIFPDSISVGASAGIFGIIGIVCVMKWKNGDKCKEILKKRELIYIIVFSLLSLMLGLESFVTHLVAFGFGVIAGLLLQEKMKSN